MTPTPEATKPPVLAPILAGVSGALAGFASSFAIVMAGAVAVGATAGQAASGLLVVSLVQGVLAIVLSATSRWPISIAWSTPGAAVLVGAGTITQDFPTAVAAFIVVGVMIALTGLWPWLSRVMTSIPAPIGSAMLAGILLPICLVPVEASMTFPALALPPILVWLVLSRFAARWAVPAAVLLTVVLVIISAGPSWAAGVNLAPHLELVAPSFADPLAIVSLAIPMYIVTMAGQNIPGFTVLHTYGYAPAPARQIMLTTGLASAVSAPFGAQTVNLSALSAAIMVGDEHTPRDRRWIATATGGIVYILLGLTATVAGALITASPTILIVSVAGLALLGALITAIMSALEDARARVVAVGTFIVVASGMTVFGFGSAVWGLIVGTIIWLVFITSARKPRAEADATA
ncbi:benzoate/H(+) symporter BenE family transporter [Microbacterium sp. YY-03]|uniref:benzoate/H(+) symporter BenE family transporter n=1 Tax=Microbacterium sp. YY-03 TaxID=3421636 RepID=UPI003D16A1CE